MLADPGTQERLMRLRHEAGFEAPVSGIHSETRRMLGNADLKKTLLYVDVPDAMRAREYGLAHELGREA
jgi:hypothetical protein